MNLIRFDRWFRIFKYLVWILLCIEVTLWCSEKIYYRILENSNTNELNHEMLAELKKVQKESVLYPTRWYTNSPNFNGKYVTTDESGFRIKKSDLKNAASIGFFGGSTMFSVATDQAHTIPNQVSIHGTDSLNFGIGGYSTTAEIPTLIEASRKYPNLKMAIFYDGVNEIARGIEAAQDKKTGLFKQVGYYYKPLIEYSIEELNPNGFYWRGFYIQRAVKKILNIAQPRTLEYEIDINSLSNDILELYFQNLQTIKSISSALNITPVFIFQPMLFTTNKKLTKEEVILLESDRTIAPKIAKEVYSKLIVDPRFFELKIYDLTSVLNEATEKTFTDWCHVNSAGNIMIARRIEEIIKSELSAQAQKNVH